MKKHSLTAILALALVLAFFGSVNTGCSFDNEQDYYAHLQCDTSNVTYSGSVAPIFAATCNSCHSPGGGSLPDLSVYDNVRDYIQSDTGGIPARIRHVAGYDPMPKSAPKLPECDIRKIEIWINSGFPNN